MRHETKFPPSSMSENIAPLSLVQKYLPLANFSDPTAPILSAQNKISPPPLTMTMQTKSTTLRLPLPPHSYFIYQNSTGVHENNLFIAFRSTRLCQVAQISKNQHQVMQISKSQSHMLPQIQSNVLSADNYVKYYHLIKRWNL